MGLPQGLVTQSSTCVPAQGWGHTRGDRPERRVCVPAKGWGCTRACPERRVCVPPPGLVGHIWGPTREEGVGGAAEVGSSPQVAVGPWA